MIPTFIRSLRSSLLLCALASALVAGSIQNATAGYAGIHDETATSVLDDKVKPDCNTPMAHYNFHTQIVSLNIMDTPVGYTPPRGPDMHFTVTYNQREILPTQNQNFPPLPNFGPKWLCNWIAYIDDFDPFREFAITVYPPGGGSKSFNFYYGPTTELLGGAEMVRHPSPPVDGVPATSYERILPDGSRQVFALRTPGVTPIRYFMTKLIDPTGQEANFGYDPSTFRLTSVTDALNQSFAISYVSADVNSPDYYLIQSVEDFAHRTATFEYNGERRLWKIHDAIGITSEFLYNETGEYEDDFITKMVTPYGSTRFSQPTSIPYAEGARTLQAIEPDGGIERLEYQQGPATGISPSDPNLPEFPPGNGYLNYLFDNRNTFYWDKKAMAMFPPDADGIPNFSKAKLTHWLHAGTNRVSNIKEREKWPLERPIYYRYAGQSGFEASVNLGTQGVPSIAGRRLDDGSTQFTQYEYDNPYQRMTKAIDALDRVTYYEYAANGIDLVAVRQRNPAGVGGSDYDPNDLIFSCIYNDYHQPLQVTDASGQTTIYHYTPEKQLDYVENARSERTSYEYGDNSSEDKPLGYLTKITSPAANGASAITTFTYDYAHRVHEVTILPDDYNITIDYDALDRPTQITYLDGTTQQFGYTDNVTGAMTLDLTRSKDRLDRWTYRDYNSNRRLKTLTEPESRVTRFEWCTCGSLASITDPNTNVTTFVRDLQSRLTSKIFADGSGIGTTVNYVYEDTTSRLKSVTDALNQKTNYHYRKDDNLEQVSYTNALKPTPTVNLDYDPYYNRIQSMTTEGIGTTTYTYYPAGTLGANRLHTSYGLFPNDTIEYTYDQLGRTRIQTVNGVENHVERDPLGRSIDTWNPLGHFTRGYDGATPRLDTLTYPNGQTAKYTYFDNLKDRRLRRLENLTDSGATVLSQFDYTPDPEGQITTWFRLIGEKTSERWFDYDDVRQLKSVHDAEQLNESTYALDFGYDLGGNRTSDHAYSPLTFNYVGLLHAYTPNALNQIGLVETTQSDGPTIPTWLTWDANGNMTYDGTHLTFEWDAANRLSAVTHTDSGERTEFAYDGLGRRVKITEYGPGVTATIQPKGSEWTTFNTAPFTLPTGSYTLTFEGLISNGDALAIIDSVTLDSTLVGNGNFESPEVSQSSGGYEYQPSGATWSFIGHTGIASNGSDLTSNNQDAPDGRQAGFLQAVGRIFQTRTVSAGTYTLSFQAAQGGNNTGEQQVRVTLRPSAAAPKIKTFVWCGTQICEERDATGATVTKRFLAEGEQRIGGRDAGNYYYSRDHLGSIREVTDTQGELRARYDYDAYGNSVVVDGKMNVDFGYTGHYFHAPSGLNLTLYRAYNPALGRWLSHDPIGEVGGTNLYEYVGNNPINLWDPLGLKRILIGIAPLWFADARDNSDENNSNAIAILKAIEGFKRSDPLDGDTVDVKFITSRESLVSKCEKYDDTILFAHGNTTGTVQNVALGLERVPLRDLPSNCTRFGCTIGQPEKLGDVIDQILQQLKTDLGR